MHKPKDQGPELYRKVLPGLPGIQQLGVYHTSMHSPAMHIKTLGWVEAVVGADRLGLLDSLIGPFPV